MMHGRKGKNHLGPISMTNGTSTTSSTSVLVCSWCCRGAGPRGGGGVLLPCWCWPAAGGDDFTPVTRSSSSQSPSSSRTLVNEFIEPG